MRGFILRWSVGAVVLGCLAVSPHAQEKCRETVDGLVCSSPRDTPPGNRPPTPPTPQIVAGTLVDLATQQNLGLVTVGGGCSGTLVNRFWVLTADHCVTTGGTVNGPAASFASVAITAAWSSRTVIPTRFVRNWGASGLDIALIFLGAGDFGSERIQLFFVEEVDTTMRLMKFGRGISSYASAGPPAVPAVNDGLYRSAAPFTPSAASDRAYTLPVNGFGQVGNGGDSGGPDYVMAPNNVLLGIAGVQSSCWWTGRVPGMPALPVWTWVTSIRDCTSAAINTARFDIVQITQEGRIPCPGPSVACAIAETTSLTLMLH
ncbi:MAG: trypsin-like serine protease [Acidobacteriota bacterium]